MPKRPSFESPLRAVRKALRLSQAEFAKILRVSEPYIQAIELGLRTISDDLAEEVSFRFGVTAKSLKQKEGTPSRLVKSDASLEEAIQSWTRDFAKREEGNSAHTVTAELMERYARLLENAGTKGHALLLQFLFDRWLRRTARDLGLDGGVAHQVGEPAIQNDAGFSMFDVITESRGLEEGVPHQVGEPAIQNETGVSMFDVIAESRDCLPNYPEKHDLQK